MKRKIIGVSSKIFPRTTAYYAYKLLTNPQLKKIRQHELEVLDKAKKKIISFNKFKIQLYEWGNKNNEPILLVHGWEGHSGNFSDIIEQLLKHNYYILAFDAPSHGFSTKGQTNMLEFSDLIIHLLEKYEPKKIISHSFGAVVTTYALSRIPTMKIDKYVLITTPDTFLERINSISNQVGISKKAQIKLIKRLESEINTKVSSISVSKFVKNVSVKKALILHDKNDKVIPIRQAKLVNETWENSTLEEIENTGHFRILREPFVITRIINFLKSE